MIAIAVLLAAGYAAYRITLWQRVESRLASIRTEGYPVTVNELDAWYPLPPAGENAATLLLLGFSYLSSSETGFSQVPFVGTNVPPRDHPLSHTVRSAIDVYLENNKHALPHLHEGARMKQSRYPIDLRQGHGTLLRHINSVRYAVRLLCVESLCAAENNDGANATRALVDAFRIARSLEHEPVIISQMVLLWTEDMSLLAVEQALNRCSFDEMKLRELDQAVTEAETAFQPMRGFAGLRCIVLDATLNYPEAEAVARGEPIGPMDRLHYESLEAAGVRDMRICEFLDRMDQFFDASASWAERVKAIREIAPEPREPTNESGEFGRTILGMFGDFMDPFTEPLSYLEWSVRDLDRCLVRQLGLFARLRCAQTAIAIERYRLETHALPSSLAVLVPAYLVALPVDPFDGAPLRYCPLPTGYVVYSVGENEKDDGGMEKAPLSPKGSSSSRAGPPPDITFTMERPPQ